MHRTLNTASSVLTSLAALLLCIGVMTTAGSTFADDPIDIMACPEKACNNQGNPSDLSGCMIYPPANCGSDETCGSCEYGTDGYGEPGCYCSFAGIGIIGG